MNPRPSRLARLTHWFVNLFVVLFIGTIFVLAGFRIAAARREIYSRREAAPSTGRFVRAADVWMFLQQEGPRDGPPVVLIHGTGAWSEIWRSTMHALSGAGYRAIALDMPPFGFSSRPTPADYSDSAQARRILVALDSLGLKRVTFVGHSFGARPTMEAIFIAPERVSRLVLVDAALDLMRGCGGAGMRGCGTAKADSVPKTDTTGSWFVREVLGTRVSRNMVVASTLSNPHMTGWLLSRLVYNRDSAVTPARVAMLQRPFILQDWTAGLGAWLEPLRDDAHHVDGDRSLALREARDPDDGAVGREGFPHPAPPGAGPRATHSRRAAGGAPDGRPHPRDRGREALQRRTARLPPRKFKHFKGSDSLIGSRSLTP